MKSLMKISRRVDTSFSKDEEIWLVMNAEGKTKMQLRRAYIIHFGKTNKHKIPDPSAFARIVNHFKVTGGVTGCSKGDEFCFTARMPENIERVRVFFEENP